MILGLPFNMFATIEVVSEYFGTVMLAVILLAIGVVIVWVMTRRLIVFALGAALASLFSSQGQSRIVQQPRDDRYPPEEYNSYEERGERSGRYD